MPKRLRRRSTCCQADGGEAEAFIADLCDLDQTAGAVDRCVAAFGGIDILVNNAHAGPYKALLEQDLESWNECIQLAMTAPFVAIKQALPHMIKKGAGAIINVASINGFQPANNCFAYAAVKGAMLNMTRQLAGDYGRHGIRANALCPGFVTTEQRDDEFANDPQSHVFESTFQALGRFGQPEEIASAARFLLRTMLLLSLGTRWLPMEDAPL